MKMCSMIPGSVVLLLIGMLHESLGEEIVIPARRHSAKSTWVVPVDRNTKGLVVCHGAGAMQEWKFNMAKGGKYFLHAYYASGQSRPVRLAINGQQQGAQFLGRVTGGFHAEHLAWDTIGPFDLRQGANTIRIDAQGTSPHLGGWVISDDGKQWNRAALAKLFPNDGERPSGPLASRPAPANPIETEKAATLERLEQQIPGGERLPLMKTFSCWIKTESDGVIFSRSLTPNWAPESLSIQDGVLVFEIQRDGAVRGTTKLTDNQWHHVALVITPVFLGNQKLFVDGKQEAVGHLTCDDYYPVNHIKIGHSASAFMETGNFTGLIDEVHLFDRSLKQEEVKELAAGKAPNQGSILTFTFDEKAPPYRSRGAVRYAPGKAGNALSLQNNAHIYLERTAGEPSAIPYTELKEQLRGSSVGEFDELVFIKRYTYTSNHYYAEFVNSLWMPGGDLCILNLKTGEVRDLLPEMATGVFGRFDVSFDAKKIIFDWKASPAEGYRIYEVNVDGTGLRQLTFPPASEAELQEKYYLHWGSMKYYHRGTDDMHPCYLPDGGIAFISTRCLTSTLCHPKDGITTSNIYRMDADGKNMRQLSFSALTEQAPVVLPDGRILYGRWEYVDKGVIASKGLWSMRPDGTGSSEVFGNDIAEPTTLTFGRPIPGAKNKYLVLGTPHAPINCVGTIIAVDANNNIRTREPMTYFTPDIDIATKNGGFIFMGAGGRRTTERSGISGRIYRDPYPLSESQCLAACKPAGAHWKDPVAYRLALVSKGGETTVIYDDPTISCWQPIPLLARPRPSASPAAIDPKLREKNQAVCMVTNIYHGMEDVKRGSVKYIRILEQVARPWSAQRRWGGDEAFQQHVCISMNTHLGLKAQHGIVPVEADGSAHFVVPANRSIFLQALDENYMSLQTERTYVNYMPGETRSCVGCHETPNQTPQTSGATLALRRAPSIPAPQPGDNRAQRILDYRCDVQPVLNANCVECHGNEKPAGGLDLSETMNGLFSDSYSSLMAGAISRGGTGLVGNIISERSPSKGNAHYMPAKSLGSRTSVLVSWLSDGKVELTDANKRKRVEHLKKIEGHQKIHLSEPELLRITNWIDTNCQYYGSYWGRRNIQHKNHPNFRPVSTFEEATSMVSPLPDNER